MNAVSEVLRDLASALEDLGCAWYVFGAQALVAHGVPRATQDLDVTVDVDPSRVNELAEALIARGFLLRVDSDLDDWISQTFVLPVWHEAHAFPVDVVLALSELERGFARRSRVLSLGVLVPVIAVSDLVVSKILAGREQDIVDVQTLVAGGAAIDRKGIEETLALIESSLDLQGLVGRFRSCLS